MAVVSYKIYCKSCDESTHIRRRDIEDSPWSVENPYRNKGLCPSCNPTSREETTTSGDDPVDFTSLRGIGESTAENITDAGIETRQDVRDATDETLLSISGVGQTSLESMRNHTR
jgi:hypothetical protein